MDFCQSICTGVEAQITEGELVEKEMPSLLLHNYVFPLGGRRIIFVFIIVTRFLKKTGDINLGSSVCPSLCPSVLLSVCHALVSVL